MCPHTFWTTLEYVGENYFVSFASVSYMYYSINTDRSKYHLICVYKSDGNREKRRGRIIYMNNAKKNKSFNYIWYQNYLVFKPFLKEMYYMNKNRNLFCDCVFFQIFFFSYTEYCLEKRQIFIMHDFTKIPFI